MVITAIAVLNTPEEKSKLRVFHKAYGKKLLSIALYHLSKKEDAEDALQEMYLRIVRYPQTFFGIKPDKQFYYAVIVLKNIIREFQKSEEQKAEHEQPCDDVPYGGILPEDAAIGKISGEKLVRFIREMPEAKKHVLILKADYDLSTAEMADTLNISEAAVRKRLSDAYKLINDFLKGENENV